MNLLDAGELNDLRELALISRRFIPRIGAVEVDVLTAGQLRVESGADLEQAADPAADHRSPLGRIRDPGQDFQQSRLAGAVAADDAEDLALTNVERDVP